MYSRSASHLRRSVIEPLELRHMLSAYFIDAVTGNDFNTGRSPAQAWLTLGKVASHTFKHGDAVYLTGTFSNQTLVLEKNAASVSVNTYMMIGPRHMIKLGVPGGAILAGEQGDGVDISASGVTLQNLTILADPSVVNSGNYNYGIYLHNNSNVELTHEVINHVTATGFSYSGLCMQGWNTSVSDSAGFSDVLIENSSFYANQVSGIFSGAGDSTGNEFQPDFPADFYAHSNLTILNCQAYDNPGFNASLMGTSDGVNINQGNYTSGGIFISSVAGALVRNCVAYDNCFAAHGSVAIWSFDAAHVIFQSDESYNTQTLGGDGDGFDFDHGTTHSLMQSDYSHGNVGAGFLLATTGGTSNNDGDTIRFCVAQGNGSGIYLPIAVPIFHANIYNNTVLQSDAAGASSIAIGVEGDSTGQQSVNILNNIFYTSGVDPLVLFNSHGEPNVHLEGNDYWVAGTPGMVRVSDLGTIYTSLVDWSAATGGYETLAGKMIGLVEDPKLINESAGNLSRAQAAAFSLQPSSSLQHQGLNLSARTWAGSTPYNFDKPYNLAGSAWGGLGKTNFFGRPINRRAVGAG